MKHCLSERRLVLAHMGEGGDADRAHVRSCAACATRGEALARDLSLIGGVLLDPPPALPRPHAVRALGHWVPATAVLAVAAIALVVTVRVTREVPEVVARGESVTVFASEVSRALFAAEANRETQPTSDLAYLQAAVGGELPCGSGTDLDGHCDSEYTEIAYWDD